MGIRAMGLSEWVIYVSPRIVREPGLQLVKTVEHLLEMGDSHQAKGATVRSTGVCMASGAWSAQKECECAQRDGAQRGSAPKDARMVLDQAAQLSRTLG